MLNIDTKQLKSTDTISFQLTWAQPTTTPLNFTELKSPRPNPTQLISVRLVWSQLNSAEQTSTEANSTPHDFAPHEATQLNNTIPVNPTHLDSAQADEVQGFIIGTIVATASP